VMKSLEWNFDSSCFGSVVSRRKSSEDYRGLRFGLFIDSWVDED
jgi:hypothetical protein